MQYDKLELIERKADKILAEVKKESDSGFYSNALYLIIACFLIGLGGFYIEGGSNFLVYAAAGIIALVAFRFMVVNAAKDVESKQSKYNIINDNKFQVFSFQKFLDYRLITCWFLLQNRTDLFDIGHN